jgi:uncharacterized membrane protein
MNKHTLILSVFFLVVLALSFPSCVKDTGKLPKALSACDTITYNKHIKQIIADNCTSCHSDTNPIGGFPLTQYGFVKAKGEAGRIKARVIDQIPAPMPPTSNPQLTQAQKDLINCWLTNGFKE